MKRVPCVKEKPNNKRAFATSKLAKVGVLTLSTPNFEIFVIFL